MRRLFIFFFAATLSAAEFTSLIDFRTDRPSAWKSTPLISTPSHSPEGLRFPLVFPGEKQRVLHERPGSWNLSRASGFRFRVNAPEPDRILEGSIIFVSGPGTYTLPFTLHRTGFNSLYLPKSDARIEGRPHGWDRIDAIRFAFWPRGNQPTTLTPLSLESVRADLVILSGEARAQTGDERYLSRVTLWHLQRILQTLGLPYAIHSVDALNTLPDAAVVFVPYLPNPTAADTRALIQHLDRGRKLIVWESSQSDLARRLGVDLGPVRASETVGLYDQLRFQAPGFPDRVFQHAWRFHELRPRSGAQVLATWGNAQGENSNLPAAILHRKGAWFAASWRSGDVSGKADTLFRLLETLAPDTLAPAADFLTNTLPPAASPDTLEGPARFLQTRADHYRNRARTATGLDQVRALRNAHLWQQRTDARRAPPWNPPMVGIWDQQGTGFFAGSWDETARILKEAGFTAVFPNLSNAARAHYPSRYLTPTRTLRDHGDQLRQASEAARKHGLELHVWRINWQLKQPEPDMRERLRREGRLMQDSQGRDLNWLSISHPDNVQLEIDILLEIARSAPVHGLHLDYMRYPDSNADYGPAARRAFEQRRGRPVANWPADVLGPLKDEFTQFRQDEIHRAMEQIHRAVRREFPDIVLSAAVWGAWPDVAVTRGQDWPRWAREGWVDLLMPMNYTDNPHQFASWLETQRRQPGVAERLVPGIGIISTNAELTPAQTLEQLCIAREINPQGVIFYRLDTSLPYRFFPYLHSP
jgi:uncharacterized lipoprotein YddW (UPF0748 family)